MRPPFTIEQFLDVFRRYNEAVLPMQAVLVLVALVIAGAAIHGSRRGSRLALALLALLWLWMAVSYHLAFYTTLSALGYLFAAMFVAESMLLMRLAMGGRPPTLSARRDLRGIIAAALVAYALAGYPLAALAAGHRYPTLATFGVPCPTTIFTFGVLLLVADGLPRSVLIVPAAWALVGASAPLLFGMWEDIGLAVAGLVAIPLLLGSPGRALDRALPPAPSHHRLPQMARLAAVGALTIAGAYLLYVSAAWLRYDHLPRASDARAERTIDRYLPAYEVREVHETRVAAPAGSVFASACTMDLYDSRVVRALFDGRELLMLRRRPSTHVSQPFLHEMTTIGWGLLSSTAGREVVYGAVTKPWEGAVRFRAIPATDFADFHEPGYARIVWSITVEPDGPGAARVRTETRVATTDAASRARFRRYWAFLSPGIILIRREALALVKHDAETRRSMSSAAVPVTMTNAAP
ncbi:MAG TPA: DUF6064 family protein [Gemmatimonadaceae bacterium]|nr:DUF6064 family protein [Gemmatimonadaceae bacterium]